MLCFLLRMPRQASSLPETTPANVMLTKIFQICRLLDQPVNLHLGPKLLALAKVLTRQLLLDTRQDLQRTRILHFLCVDVVVLGRGDGGAMAGAADDAGHLVGVVAVGVIGVADHDGLAALRGVIWFGGGGVALIEAPGEQGVVDELLVRLASRTANTFPYRPRIEKNLQLQAQP